MHVFRQRQMSAAVVVVIFVVTAFLFSLELRRRRQAEAQLQGALSIARAELEMSEQQKDEFLATASHELRTPLNAIVGWAHALQTGALAGEDEQRQAVNAIARNAKIETRLIEDLLDVSGMIQGRVNLSVAPLDLHPVIAAAVDTVKPAAAAKDITVNVESTLELLPVIGDEDRLRQVTWNLLTNAVKYTPPGGRIDVVVTSEQGRAIVRIKDSGEGIAPAFLPHVFEPFRQEASGTLRSGLGLGLAIVKRLVDLHGGRIVAESGGVGRGSQFTVSLPLARGDAAATSRPAC